MTSRGVDTPQPSHVSFAAGMGADPRPDGGQPKPACGIPRGDSDRSTHRAAAHPLPRARTAGRRPVRVSMAPEDDDEPERFRIIDVDDVGEGELSVVWARPGLAAQPS